MSEITQRPESVTDEHLEYLDGLRKSGVTNMFGGARYLIQEFDMGSEQASDTLSYWMETFGEPTR
jgi:hypothetical protein